jgi:threonine aldolase
MRSVIASAEVGDDALGDDPTVAALEQRIAQLLGKEAAVFFPTGVMANETALAIHIPRGEEAIVEASSHLVDWELGAPAALNGVTLRAISAPGGRLTPELVEAAIRPRGLLQLRTSLICIENTHSASGGQIMPLATMRAIAELAHGYGIPVYLDGSRLWNAAVATGTSEAEFAAHADTVMVGLSKGLGCPVGSVLAGSESRMLEARRVRRRMGGTMRQAGLLAAAGLYAIDHHRDRLLEDHQRARRLAERTANVPGLQVVMPETNIVVYDIRQPGLDSTVLLGRLAELGVLLSEFTPTRIRAVTHLDVNDEGIETAAAAINRVMNL